MFVIPACSFDRFVQKYYKVMEFSDIFPYLATLLGGGGIGSFIGWRTRQRKDDVDIKVNEIEAIHQTVEKVYQPIINQQNLRIQELETEVHNLRQTLTTERAEHQKQIDILQKQILDITRALGIKANKQVRDEKTGRYVKEEKKPEE